MRCDTGCPVSAGPSRKTGPCKQTRRPPDHRAGSYTSYRKYTDHTDQGYACSRKLSIMQRESKNIYIYISELGPTHTVNNIENSSQWLLYGRLWVCRSLAVLLMPGSCYGLEEWTLIAEHLLYDDDGDKKKVPMSAIGQ